MGLTAAEIKQGLDHVASGEPAVARALDLAGLPEPRIRERGYRTLLRTIVGQQVDLFCRCYGTQYFQIFSPSPIDIVLAAQV